MRKTSSGFLALLRGINVGGKNVIVKDELRQCFEDLGFTNVRTYIQSGNILFQADETRVSALTSTIQVGLSDRFSFEAQAVVLPFKKYKAVVKAAPERWGADKEQRHNALFTLSGITPNQVLAKLTAPKTEIETVTTGPGVIFWSSCKKHQSKTTLTKLPQEPVYQRVTIRNHNTVFKLLELLEE